MIKTNALKTALRNSKLNELDNIKEMIKLEKEIIKPTLGYISGMHRSHLFTKYPALRKEILKEIKPKEYFEIKRQKLKLIEKRKEYERKQKQEDAKLLQAIYFEINLTK